MAAVRAAKGLRAPADPHGGLRLVEGLTPSSSVFPQPHARAASIASPDKMPGFYREAMALSAFADDPATSERDGSAAFARMSVMKAEASASRPTTMAGAVACLEWARAEHVRFNMMNPDNGGRLVLAMLDGALGVLRAGGADA